jgi:hypothetical protein
MPGERRCSCFAEPKLKLEPMILQSLLLVLIDLLNGNESSEENCWVFVDSIEEE